MKQHLRKEMKARLAAMSPQEAAGKSHRACKSLIGLPEFLRARTVMLYLPMAREPDTAEVALHAWGQGKVVLAPRVDWSEKRMAAVEIRSLDDGVVTGEHGVPQPAEGQVWPVEEIDFIVVPALAYDRAGGRLGRGGGFYDRFLARPAIRAVTCGLAFDEQVVERLPEERHDRPVDMLVTDKEVLRFGKAPGQDGRELEA